MGLFGNRNKCPFKDLCVLEEICSHVAAHSYEECGQYEVFTGADNRCPYKDVCPIFPTACVYGNDPTMCFHYMCRNNNPTDQSSYNNTYCNDEPDVNDDSIKEPDESMCSDDFDKEMDETESSLAYETTSQSENIIEDTIRLRQMIARQKAEIAIKVRKIKDELAAKENEETKTMQEFGELNAIPSVDESMLQSNEKSLEKLPLQQKAENVISQFEGASIETVHNGCDKVQVAKIEFRKKLNDKRNYMAAALLAIFLGGIGAHKFYMGKPLKGLIYFVFCWTWIPSVIGVIEGIKYLFEGQNKFSERFVDNE